MRLTPILLLCLPLLLSAAEVRTGDTLAEVRTALGPPRGQVQAGEKLRLYYERGEVELQDGVVTRVALLSRSEHQAETERRGEEARRLLEEQTIRRAALTAEGEALLARKLADPAFRAAAPVSQVAFWEDFTRRYPEVPAHEHLLLARLRLAEVQETRRQQTETAERIARLEARAAEAEARSQETVSALRPRTYLTYYPRPGHRPANLWPIDYGDFNFSHPLGTPLHELGGTPAPRTEDENRRLKRNKPRYPQHDDRPGRLPTRRK